MAWQGLAKRHRNYMLCLFPVAEYIADHARDTMAVMMAIISHSTHNPQLDPLTQILSMIKSNLSFHYLNCIWTKDLS